MPDQRSPRHECVVHEYTAFFAALQGFEGRLSQIPTEWLGPAGLLLRSDTVRFHQCIDESATIEHAAELTVVRGNDLEGRSAQQLPLMASVECDERENGRR